MTAGAGAGASAGAKTAGAGIVAITGGTGFLGRNCAATLAAAGWRIRLLVRRDPSHPSLDGLKLDLIQGDLADDAALIRLVQGADAIIHAAGAIKAASLAAFLATNRDGASRLAMHAAQHAPNASFVHISSQAARHPGLSAYAASKRAGELAVLDAHLPHCAILRPCVIYGPWDEATASLLRLANGRIVPLPRAPEPRLAMLHVSDAATAIAAFCEPRDTEPPDDIAPKRRTAFHEIHDGAQQGHAWRDIVRAASGNPNPSFLPLPDAAFALSGALADTWSALTRKPLLFGRGKAREFLQRDWRPDPALTIPPELWTPKISLEQGLAATKQFYAGNP